MPAFALLALLGCAICTQALGFNMLGRKVSAKRSAGHYHRGRSRSRFGPDAPHCSDVGLDAQAPILSASSRRALTQNSDPASCACMEPAVLSGSCASAQVRG